MPASESVFIDTNVVLYALGTEEPKRTIAQGALNSFSVISVQVLSEASHILHRKQGIPKTDVVLQLGTIEALVDRIVPLNKATVQLSWRLWQRYHFSWFDSLIVAAALDSDCTTLYTEDLQHGQIIGERLTIINPFSPS